MYVVTTYFSSHDETRGRGVDGDITGHQAYVVELFEQISVLLIAQGFDRRGVDDTLLVTQGHGDSVQCDHCLTSRGVRTDQDTVALLQARQTDL